MPINLCRYNILATFYSQVPTGVEQVKLTETIKTNQAVKRTELDLKNCLGHIHSKKTKLRGSLQNIL